MQCKIGYPPVCEAIAIIERRAVSVVDITGAYLYAEIGREVAVHMRLDRMISGLITMLRPEYSTYLDHRGSITLGELGYGRGHSIVLRSQRTHIGRAAA